MCKLNKMRQSKETKKYTKKEMRKVISQKETKKQKK